ncbi:MAG: rubrerythrin, partial [Flavonifractor sp.]|nr:rubrerythrin [Flavonifractor sp.]
QCSYLAAAEETTDSCLRELYLELAGDEETHAGLLRSILEQM